MMHGLSRIENALHYAVGSSSLGSVLLARTQRGVCAISLGDDIEVLLEALQSRLPRATLRRGAADVEEQLSNLIAWIEDPSLAFSLELDINGTPFQIQVWQSLRCIPMGQTLSYTDIAIQLGLPKAARAVANACAANRLAIAIPCHRVIKSDGTISGYRWGEMRKERLLARERLFVSSC